MTIKTLHGRKDLGLFVRFQLQLYKGVEAYVPPMINSELDCLDTACNPAFAFCEAAFFMVYDDAGHAVGRIATVINRRANERSGVRQCRFCYCDFIDDSRVSRLLLDTAAAYGRSHGMDTLVGPLGLTDLDAEGCLIEGFDQLATTAEIYNFPYYVTHYQAYGMQADAFWNAYRVPIPATMPEKYLRVQQYLTTHYGLRVLQFTDAKEIVARYGHAIFHLYNEAYAPLYGFTPLTDEQIDYYIRLYLPQVRLDMVGLITDSEGQLLGFGIACPSLSEAQQRAHGKMWPFGWMHLARAMYLNATSRWGRLLGGTSPTCDLLLMAVRPEWQGRGLHALLFCTLVKKIQQSGFRYVETNNELVTNKKINNIWATFQAIPHKRRCTFTISLS